VESELSRSSNDIHAIPFHFAEKLVFSLYDWPSSSSRRAKHLGSFRGLGFGPAVTRISAGGFSR